MRKAWILPFMNFRALSFYKTWGQRWNASMMCFFYYYVAYYVYIITYHCEITDVLLSETFGTSSKIVLVYLIYIAAIWWTAAEFHEYISKSVSQWYHICKLSTPNDPVLRQSFMAINFELDSDPIAITTKYFVVTYGYLKSVSILNKFTLNVKLR